MTDAYNSTALTTQYHRIEDYFFHAISLKRRAFAEAACAYVTGVPAGSLNLLIVKQEDDALSERLAQGVQFMEDAKCPYSIQVANHLLPQLAEELKARNFNAAYTSTAMFISLQEIATEPPPKGIMVKRIDRFMQDWRICIKSAYEVDDTIALPYQKQHQTAIEQNKQLTHFGLYINNQLASTISFSRQTENSRIDDLATIAAMQGLRYDTLLLQHTLAFAQQQSAAYCFVEAADENTAFYTHAGFTPLFEYTSFYRIEE